MVKISIPFIITLILVLLKIFGVITCSWLWVFCLLWLPIVISFGALFIAIFITMLFMILLLIIDLITNE